MPSSVEIAGRVFATNHIREEDGKTLTFLTWHRVLIGIDVIYRCCFS